ncbi:MAG: NAD(+) diphosphatase [Deltaproteobacteria bacterium]|nr:MAG: NAD(+) diphosphatase [Deltaproteobacteria bacterium]
MPCSAMGSHVFAGSPLDRVSHLRMDADWLAARLDDPNSRFLPLWRLDVLVRHGSGPSLAWARRELLERMDREVGAVLLGVRDGVAHFALDLSGLEQPDRELALEGQAEFQEVRGLAAQLEAGDAAIAAQARALVDWHVRHRFCAACGEPTRSEQGGWLRRCPACAVEHFPRTDPVVIMLIARGDRCLLARQRRWPERMFSALAGFMEPGESIEEAVRREVCEESGIRVGGVRYHSSQPWPFPSSLMIGCLGDAETEAIRVDPAELEEARWFPRGEVRAALNGSSRELFVPPPMAIAHHLVRAWVESEESG